MYFYKSKNSSISYKLFVYYLKINIYFFRFSLTFLYIIRYKIIIPTYIGAQKGGKAEAFAPPP